MQEAATITPSKWCAEFPKALQPLFRPKRFKVAHGGRGGGKSWAFARALLILGAQRKIRVLCCREIQNSIDDSVYQVLVDQIVLLGLQDRYRIGRTKIWGLNGTVFMFAGLWMNVDSIKSKEAIDVVWVEEAHKVSRTSWQKLIPSIRKDAPGGPLGQGSEIWVSFNPELATDDTYHRFILHPPSNAFVMEINWRDNPWFPKVLYDDMIEDRERNYDDYLHIWEGKVKQFLEGAIYANELRAASQENRITKVPYSHEAPVHTFWDIGWSDLTSIWFAQKIGMQINVIDFWQGRKTKIEDVFKEGIRGRRLDDGAIVSTGYQMGTYFLPHDAAAGNLASNGMSVKQLVEAADGRQGCAVIVPSGPGALAQGINAARTVFPRCWFDEERCADGLQALRHYRYDIDEETKQFSRLPLHDENSHPADAFRYLAVSINNAGAVTTPELTLTPTIRRQPLHPSQSWMRR